jgi:hypothetical protein
MHVRQQESRRLLLHAQLLARSESRERRPAFDVQALVQDGAAALRLRHAAAEADRLGREVRHALGAAVMPEQGDVGQFA